MSLFRSEHFFHFKMGVQVDIAEIRTEARNLLQDPPNLILIQISLRGEQGIQPFFLANDEFAQLPGVPFDARNKAFGNVNLLLRQPKGIKQFQNMFRPGKTIALRRGRKAHTVTPQQGLSI